MYRTAESLFFLPLYSNHTILAVPLTGLGFFLLFCDTPVFYTNGEIVGIPTNITLTEQQEAEQ